MSNTNQNTEFADWDNLPKEVELDMNNGFIMTDIDDRFQRCKKISDTTFLYRAGLSSENDLDEEEIDVSLFSDEEKNNFVSGYYDSLSKLEEECDGCIESVNMLVAECYFETEVC